MTKEEIIALVVETVRKHDAKQKKVRHDRRLYNTRLLMKNYKVLMDHCNQSITAIQDIEQNESAIDILDSIDDTNRELYIETIKRSNLRTYIILQHIESMLQLLEIYCERTDKSRCYRVLSRHYVDGDTLIDIAKRENVERRTVYRDINFAIEKLSALIFGVDGLAVMS